MADFFNKRVPDRMPTHLKIIRQFTEVTIKDMTFFYSDKNFYSLNFKENFSIDDAASFQSSNRQNVPKKIDLYYNDL